MVGSLKRKIPRIGVWKRALALLVPRKRALALLVPRKRALALLVPLLFVLASLLAPAKAQAWSSGSWYLNRASSRKVWSFSFELGARYLTHYNREVVLTTPPDTGQVEGQLMLFYKKSVAIYVTGGKSVRYASSYSIGGGLRFPFVTLAGNARSSIAGLSMQFLVDGVYHSTEPDYKGRIYDDKTLLIRYGGSILWGISRSGLFLDTTMMATKFSGNFFIAPLVGLGYHF